MGLMNKKFFYIISAGLLVGTFDIVAAFLYYFLKTGNKDVFNVLKYVASGVFGKEAATGGGGMILAGLLFHYSIALSFTLLFFWIYPYAIAFLRNKFLLGIVYGVFVWSVMNLVVVPLSKIGPRPFNPANALINLLILVICIGIPLSLLAGSVDRRKRINTAVRGA